MSKIRRDDGFWLDVSVFRERALYFKKYGYYNNDPWGSPGWMEYWERERERCLNGYEVDGHRITGDHYFYLNYTQIQKTDKKNVVGKRAKKIRDFPDFWDGDYDYFWIREIARNGILGALRVDVEEQKRVFKLPEEEKLKIYEEHLNSLKLIVKPVISCDNLEGGKDIILGKSRRKGFSYKNASAPTNTYFHRMDYYNLLMAYEKKYLFPGMKTIFGKVKANIDFINSHTGWIAPSDTIDKQNHIRNSYVEYINGKKVEKGRMTEIEAVSFKDNPDAGRGSDTYDIIGEEVGAWGIPGGLKDTIAAMRSSAEDGGYKTGMMTLFGTSGDIEGGTADFADLFNRPGANNFMEFYDIWGKNPDKIEGFFFPKQLNAQGFYDENGNSDIEAAKQAELRHREMLVKKGATNTEILKRMQEEPLNSAEAFSMISTNNFPVVELREQLEKVKSNHWQETKGTPVDLLYNEGRVIAKPILKLSDTRQPITSLTDIPINKQGIPIIYEYPIEGAPKGLYKIGYDPVRQDSGTSLAAIIVYKGVMRGSYTHDIIVAEYIGRMENPEDMDRIAMMFAEFYNTKIMHENEVTGVKNFFRRIKRLDLLAVQPDVVISKNIKKSKVARVYGSHMTDGLKDAAERYTKEWLLMVIDHDEHGNPVRAIDKIYSKRLLEELISYHRKGNYDLVSALFMALFQVQEEVLGKEYNVEKENPKLSKLSKRIEKMYVK